MTTLEDRLRASMQRGASAAEVPAPPDLREAARGRQARRRGLTAVLGSAVLVAAIVAVPQLAERPSVDAPPATRTPTPPPTSAPLQRLALSFDDLPKGPAPRAPYVQQGKLFVDGRAADTAAASGLVAAGGTVLVQDGAGWHLVEGAAQRGPIHSSSRPMLSPNGRYLLIAQEVQTSGIEPPTVMTAIDLRDGFARMGVHTVTQGVPAREPAIELLGIDDDARVFWRQPVQPAGEPAGTYVWFAERGHAEQIAFGWEGDRVLAVGSRELLVQHAGGRDGYVGPLVTEPDGTDSAVKKRWAVTGAETGVLSPEGGYLFEHQAWITPLDGDAERIRPLLDGALAPQLAAFESEQAVLLHVDDGERQGIARCRTRDGACELALEVTGGARPRFAVPRTWVMEPGRS